MVAAASGPARVLVPGLVPFPTDACCVAIGVADDDSEGVVVLLGGVSPAADSHGFGFVVNPN